jgi:hypothetical protein
LGAEETPQIFLLSGWGEPGSAFNSSDSDPGSSGSWRLEHQGRRTWTCWCAIHRPPATARDKSESFAAPRSPLIILELELERDIIHPLYPPQQQPRQVITTVSPASIESPHSASAGSGKDSHGSSSTVGQMLSQDDTANGASSSITITALGSVGSVGSTDGHAEDTSLKQQLREINTRLQNAELEPPVEGLEGDDNWHPSMDHVFESTTNHAKPLRALERMRRMGARSDNPRRGASTGKGSKGRRRAKSSGVGTMDVFAVLSQINEQLDAAQDLATFLKVVVGVVQDLTQFHRVLVYQFDENWNGQVVAELVDWNQTHDLYNTLHFPATDIPAQVSSLVICV